MSTNIIAFKNEDIAIRFCNDLAESLRIQKIDGIIPKLKIHLLKDTKTKKCQIMLDMPTEYLPSRKQMKRTYEGYKIISPAEAGVIAKQMKNTPELFKTYKIKFNNPCLDRVLFFNNPKDKEIYDQNNDFMLGELPLFYDNKIDRYFVIIPGIKEISTEFDYFARLTKQNALLMLIGSEASSYISEFKNDPNDKRFAIIERET